MKRLKFLFLLGIACGCSSFSNRNSIGRRPSQRNHGSILLSTETDALAAAHEGESLSTEQTQSNKQASSSLYLFSLPATSQASSNHGAVLTKRLWEWKDAVLGDGRDFFVPRPKTIKALNRVLCQQTNATEAVVLSNCARFDVILVMDHQKSEEELRNLLAHTLLQQYGFYKQKKGIDLSMWFDNDQPGRLLTKDTRKQISVDDYDWKTLSRDLQCLEGPSSVALYMCRVATGLQPQGRRPDRPVVFRPFNSRDAHVMLQLKRTADIASAGETSSSPRIKALLDQALQSGKAARDPAIVPAILPLKRYGSGGNSGRYSLGDAPAELTLEAAMQAESLAIQPMVAKYIQKWSAFEASEQIRSFRLAVEEAVQEHLGLDLQTSPKAKPLRAMIHPYVMEIREGRVVDVDIVVEKIREFQ